MPTYPIDIDPGQMLRWLKAESEAAPGTFRISARRGEEVRQLPAGGASHLGDVEREDLSEVATVATLEVAPVHAHEGWLLRIVVEDELGPRMLGAAGEGEQAIDLATFYSEYIRPGRGIASVVADVDDTAGRHRLNRLLAEIEKNRHVSAGPASSAANPRKGDKK